MPKPPSLVQALDLLELAAEQRAVDALQASAAWELIEQHSAHEVPSWYRATRPPRAGPESKIAVIAPKRAMRGATVEPAADADLLAAMLFAVGQPVPRENLLDASGWTPARLQAAIDLVQRLLKHLESGNLIEPLDLPETVWLVLAIIILDQPITRAEITARRMADSDRQVQVLLRHRLIREEPRAAVPGRGIPLVTTDLVLRRFGVGWIGELQDQLLAAAAERELGSTSVATQPS